MRIVGFAFCRFCHAIAELTVDVAVFNDTARSLTLSPTDSRVRIQQGTRTFIWDRRIIKTRRVKVTVALRTFDGAS